MGVNWRTALAALGLVSALACDGATSIYGTIRDKQGHPVVGATVTLTAEAGGAWSVMSGPEGRFQITRVHAPKSTVRSRLTVAADGLRSITMDVVGTATYECEFEFSDRAAADRPITVSRDSACRRLR